MAGSPRVVHIVRQFLPNRGGLEDVVYHLCREQIRQGFDVRVVTLDRLFTKLDVKLPVREEIDGIKITRIPFHGSTRYPVAPHVFRHIGDADLLHVHAIDFFFDALAMTKLFHRKPLVATTHGGFFHTKDFSRLKTLWFNGPTRFSARCYDAIAACGRGDFEAFSTICGSKAHLIENGVDLEKFAGASSATPVRRLVSLGRFSKNKRPERLIETMAYLAAKDPAWHLDLIGAVSDWDEAALHEEIARYGLADHVSLLIGLDNKAIAERMSGASLFVSASEFEGFGLAVIEAMSAGLVPVVQTNAAFSALAEKHGDIRLADFMNPVAAAALIEETYDLLAEGRIARPQAAELKAYSWGHVAELYTDLYRGIFQARHTAFTTQPGNIAGPLHRS